MHPTSKLLAVVSLALLTVPAVAAQITSGAQVGGFGSQVRVGDYDYLPLLKTSKKWTVAELEAGSDTDVTDNCIIVMYDDSPAHSFGATTWPSQKAVAVNKDLRLTACEGKPAGSQVSAVDVNEKVRLFEVYSAADAGASIIASLNTQTLVGTNSLSGNNIPASREFAIIYGDADNNGKFGKGDPIYLTVGTPASGDILAPTRAMGSWTIRLTAAVTPTATYPAGTFVLPGDKDWTLYHTFSAQTRNDKGWIIGEREDKGFYLMPTDGFIAMSAGIGSAGRTTQSTVLAGSPLPVNAVRLGIANLFSLQPSIIVTGAELANPDAAEAGKAMPVIVTMTNNGAQAGYGVIVTKLDKQIVDVRMSPLLSPGEFTKTIVTIGQVPHGGQQELEVNDVFAPVFVKGATGTVASGGSGASSGDVAALQGQVTELQSRLASLEATRGETVQAKGSPSVAPLAALGCLVAVALVLRRRAA